MVDVVKHQDTQAQDNLFPASIPFSAMMVKLTKHVTELRNDYVLRGNNDTCIETLLLSSLPIACSA